MPAKGFGNDIRTMQAREYRARLGRCWMILWDKNGGIAMEFIDMQIAG
jgi:hypothetical protein